MKEDSHLPYVNILLQIWGISSAGRALRWQRRGRRFDPDILHQIILNPLNNLDIRTFSLNVLDVHFPQIMQNLDTTKDTLY